MFPWASESLCFLVRQAGCILGSAARERERGKDRTGRSAAMALGVCVCVCVRERERGRERERAKTITYRTKYMNPAMICYVMNDR